MDTEEEVAVLPNLSPCSLRASKVSLKSTVSQRATKEILESNFPLNFYGNRGDVAGSSLR